MRKTKTYLDAGILIAAARGTHEVSQRAMQILGDAGREFVAGDFLRLELLPKAVYHRQTAEAEFYRTFFEAVATWIEAAPPIAQSAGQLAEKHGLNALDALHIASALAGGATELITTEKPDKPMYRVAELKVLTLQNFVSDAK